MAKKILLNKFLIILLFVIGINPVVFSHSGDTNDHACYKDFKSGRIHCH